MKLRRSLIEPTPAVSVVVPHLNDQDNLARCLFALDAQRVDGIPFEVIVVDNGSQIPPAEVCANYDYVRLAFESTPGPGPARNRGAGISRAPIIAFIDADCSADAGWIKSIVSTLVSDEEIDFLGGEVYASWVDPEHPTAVEAYERAYSYRTRIYAQKYGFAATGNMAVRKDVFEAVGPFGGIATMEDTEWGLRATAMGFRIAYAPDARVFTPACRNYTELARRWNRHIAHEYGERKPGPISAARWTARSLMIAASPAIELLRLPRLASLPDWRARALAWSVMARLRLYRAGRMISIMATNDAAEVVHRWNREDDRTGRKPVAGIVVSDRVEGGNA